jgi:PAS domain-containing protein
MPDAIIYADAEGVIRRWNRGATRIFGFAEGEALASHCECEHAIATNCRDPSSPTASCPKDRK